MIRLILTTMLSIGGHMPTPAWSADYEGAAKAFADTYVREQIKARIADYMNKNPEVVGSVSSNIGTRSMRVVGQVIAAHNFATANSDKERLFATMQFFAADPTTMLVVFAIQLGDALVTMKHQKGLAEIYERIAHYQKETVEIYAAMAIESIKEQLSLVERFGTTLAQIDQFESKIRKNPLYRHLVEDNSVLFSEDDIVEAMEALFTYEQEIRHLQRIHRLIELKVQFEALGFPPEARSSWATIVNSFGLQQSELKNMHATFLQIFVSANAAASMRSISEKVGTARDEGLLYLSCIRAINTQEEPDVEFIRLCQKRFNLNFSKVDTR